jgi:hypothetical protein
MKTTGNHSAAPSGDLADLLRGLYGRVARRLELNPSYVRRVARGERDSEIVEKAIERELRAIMNTWKRKGRKGSRSGLSKKK